MSDSKKTALWALVLLALCPVLLLSSASISGFMATRNNNTIFLQWTTEGESSLSKFEIERSIDRYRWLKIGEVPALGESNQKNTYSYNDRTLFKGNLSGVYYRLVLVDKNGDSIAYDVIASVEGSSGIRHTWGSIKAMFR